MVSYVCSRYVGGMYGGQLCMHNGLFQDTPPQKKTNCVLGAKISLLINVLRLKYIGYDYVLSPIICVSGRVVWPHSLHMHR